MGFDDLLLRFFAVEDSLIGAEIGVSKGASSARLLARFPGLSLLMVDAWAIYAAHHPYRKSGDGHARLTLEQQHDHKAEAIKVTAFADSRRRIIQADSVEAADMVPNGRLNFVIVDDDHTFEGVKRTTEAWWPKLKPWPDGVMLGHDIDHPRDRRGLWGVRKGVEEFVAGKGFALRTEGDIWWLEGELSRTGG